MSEEKLQTEQAEQEQQEQPKTVPHSVEVEIDGNGMKGYIKIIKGTADAPQIEISDLRNALKESGIVYGIKDSAIEKLAARPIYGIRIEVASGLPAEDGTDGFIDFFVKKDSEYKPDLPQEGTIDYKNLDYFQMVKEGQMLAAITKETEGTAGKDILGTELPPKPGRPVQSPRGKNTSYNEDETMLYADCDGMVRFTGNTIDINDIMRIITDVNQKTGNIRFTGDVIVDGDVCSGYSIEAGGNVVIKGMVEGARIEAGGDVQVGKGINGESGEVAVDVGGNLRCKYIENACVNVQGDIIADYIIDSRVTCMSNIDISNGRGVLVGGETKVKGELSAKDVGSEREKITKIEILGQENLDSDYLISLKNQREELNGTLQQLQQTYKKFYSPIKTDDDPYKEQLLVISKQMELIQPKLNELNAEIASIQHNWTVEYFGAVVCKRKMYHGVKIYFGEVLFTFNLDSLERCRICWAEGEVLQQTI